MLVKTYGAALSGVNALVVTAEVNLGANFGFALVGLPDSAVKESRERVEAAIRNAGYDYPRGRITVNLAPADIRKEGSAYDLTIALGILAAAGQCPADRLDQYLVMGELSLDGSVMPIKGALPIAIEARRMGYRGVLVPAANADEAAIVDPLEVLPIAHLSEAVDFFAGRRHIDPAHIDTRALFAQAVQSWSTDFADVRGQQNVKRALEVAAAGGHNVILIGPPGAGKSMLAQRLPTILPPLSLHEALETTKIHSVAGRLIDATNPAMRGLIAHRPFRSPHHTISDVALVGGGNHPQPGEISLAHHGVLFLDELPEFKRAVLEVLRQPLEERRVTISRAKFTVEYPASFMLVAAMNPCPCGYYNHPEKACVCGPGVVAKYLSRISGPLLDRIDLHVEVVPVPVTELTAAPGGDPSAVVRDRVLAARERQQHRFMATPEITSNAAMPPQVARQVCVLDAGGQQLLTTAMQRLGLSARAYDRILKVSRTIADLAEADSIAPEHVAEAIQYRNLDRDGWAG